MDENTTLRKEIKLLEARIIKLEQQLKGDLIPPNDVMKRKYNIDIKSLNSFVEQLKTPINRLHRLLKMNLPTQSQEMVLPEVQSLYSIPAIKLVNLDPEQLKLSLNHPLDFSKLNLEDILQEVEHKTREKLIGNSHHI